MDILVRLMCDRHSCPFRRTLLKERRSLMTQRLVIQNGTVITGDKELGTFPRADILVEGSLIRAVQPGMVVSESTVIYANGMIVMPCLVDAHRRTWHFTLKLLSAASD